MVNYGVRVANDNGLIQIDSEFTNHVLHSELTLGTGDHLIKVNTDRVPIVAIRQGCARITSYTRSGEKYTGINIKIYSPSSADVLVFAGQYGKSSESFGMRIYTKAGGLAFDSGNKYLKITGSYDMTDSGKTGQVSSGGKWNCLNIDNAKSLKTVTGDDFVIVSRMLAWTIVSRFEGGPASPRLDRYLSIGLIDRAFYLRTLGESQDGYGGYDIDEFHALGSVTTCRL
ncbi:hypothetical protein GCM10023116_27670 [Kistimonas scapharcae]|uniref:Uncharacterized protein n=1 Tax=Kistimonas scapharcae TaxID=1036133 RepID=A0ABP8V381_9GAMM